jgi:hypothetical protein
MNEESPGSMTLMDFRQAITGDYLKSLQIFYFSLGLGVLVFFFVTLFVYIQTSSLMLMANEELVKMLTVVHVVYALLGYMVAAFLYERFIGRKQAENAGADDAELLLNAVRLASVVRLTVVEGVAFFGLVLLFIAAQAGVLHQNPVYWLNLFSSCILMTFVFWDFPSRQRLEELCERRFIRRQSNIE